MAYLSYYGSPPPTSSARQVSQQAWQQGNDAGKANLFAFISPGPPRYILSSYDRGIYRSIFAAQQTHDWSRANALLKRLHDKSLIGHVLYERYINAAGYKASYAELQNWMVAYGDHPNAYKIYQLAQKRRNNNPVALPAPQIAKKLLGSLEFAWLNKEINSESQVSFPARRNKADVQQLMLQIKQQLGEDRVTQAYHLLDRPQASSMLTHIEYDALLSNIAAGYFYNDKYDQALKIAGHAAKRSDQSVPYAHWIAGLAAWKKQKYALSADHFKAILSSHSRNQWMLSAGAFWAARAYDKLGDTDTSNDWLQEAASYPRTFYGLIAREKLGNDTTSAGEMPVLTENLLETLRKIPAAGRALALIDLEQNTLAAQEFDQVNPNGNKRIAKALVAAANQFNLPQLAMRLGDSIRQPDAKLYDVALYPVVPWKGDTSIGVNAALTNALIRQESQFSTHAQNSHSGAKGLMQLMPRTAQFVSDKSYSASDLHKPEVNIVLGQRYIRHLLTLPQVNGNLLYLAAAYNAGPGNLARWHKKINDGDDPFLFVESIPVSETRAFVERVLTNYWIYNQRFKQETETLQSLGRDSWPLYAIKPETPKLELAAY